MTVDGGVARGVRGGTLTQPVVELVGTSLQFSDQLLRILRAEFPEVRFDRTNDVRDILGLEADPNLVVFHEGLPELRSCIDGVRSAFSRSLLAVACSDPARFQRAYQADPLPQIGLLPINVQIDVWLSVLRLMLCGHVYVPVDLGEEWSQQPPAAPLAGPDEVPNALIDARLTPREMQILPLIARGMQNKTIAGELGLSEHTVKLHTHNIYSKLKVSNRTGAANWYLSQVETPLASGYDAHGK